LRLSTKLVLFCATVVVLLLGQFWLNRVMHSQMRDYLIQHEAAHHEALGLEQQIANLNELMVDLATPPPATGAVMEPVRHWLMHVQYFLRWQREEGHAVMPAAGRQADVVPLPLLEQDMADQLRRGGSAEEVRALRERLRLSTVSAQHRLQEALEQVQATDAAARARREENGREILVLTLLAGAGGLAVVALMAGLYFARLGLALKALRRKAMEIADGDYGAPLAIDRHDEVAEVAAAINEIGRRLADRDRQLEELRVRFAEQEKMFALGVFAGGIAHEIGNPIQAIMALTDQIRQDLEDDGSPAALQRSVRQLEILSNQTDRLNTLVSRINEFACLDTDERECVDVHQAVQTTLELMRFDPRFKRAELSLDLAAENPVVDAVHDHLVQALMNILINALDAIEDPPGRIVVRTGEREGCLVLEVEDNGPGMDDAVREHALEPFFTTKPKGRGTGLGLAVSRSVISQADGELTLRSEKGKGTVVAITLPLWLSSCGEADESADCGRRDRVSAGS